MKLFGFAGWSGSGKTTAIEQAIPHLRQAGLSVSLIKHAHHNFDIDQPGKDSWRHRRAGCGEVLITSPVRWALMHELRGAAEPVLGELIEHLTPCDLVLIEGFKREPIPKLEVYRSVVGEPVMFPQDPHIVAIASDRDVECGLPQFRLDDAPALAAFILQQVGL